MPIYEFTCQGCGNNFDKLCKASDNLAEIICPACGEKKARKRISKFCSPGVGGDTGGSSCGSCSTHNCGSCGH